VAGVVRDVLPRAEIEFHTWGPPFFRACGYNTHQRRDLGWLRPPDKHAAYYAEMAADVRAMQADGFQVFVLLNLNMRQCQSGEPEGYADAGFDPGDPTALAERLHFLARTIQAVPTADGFTIFAGDPGGHPRATPADLLRCTRLAIDLVRQHAPRTPSTSTECDDG
jgi:hypothetical protein